MTSGVSGKGTEAQKHAEVLAADAGARLDNVLTDAKQGVSKIDNKLESYRQEAEKTLEQKAHEAQVKGKSAVDAFDKNVTEVSLCVGVMLDGSADFASQAASKAKSSASSWFGGSK